MLKGRRRSGLLAESAPTDTDNTPLRPRNRLTKPPSLIHNLKSASGLSLQDAESRKKAASTDSLAETQAVKIADVGKLENASSVSDIVSRFEASQQAPNNSSQQSLLGVPKERGSYRSSLNSLVNESRQSLQTIGSKDRLTVLKNDSHTSLSRSPSTDDNSDNPRYSRRSSFAPGVATRKSSVAEAIQEEREPKKPMEKDEFAVAEKVVDEDARSFDEGDDENWCPPAALPRAETPQSLDYTHLGSMGWGSLQVMNGRASPAPSNMSKHLFNRRTVARDTSSEYAESETGEQHHRGFLNSDSVYSTRNRYRDFSWQSKGSSKLQDEVPPLPPLDATGADPASFLASEYMAELPQSPYGDRQASFGSFAQRAEATSITRSPSVGSVRSYESLEADSKRSSSPTPSNTGSVLRTTTKRTEMDDELFEDETLGYATTQQRDTPESWHSFAPPVDLRTQSTQGFESALEYMTVDNLQGTTQNVSVVFGDGAEGTVITSVQIESTLTAPEQTADFRTSDEHDFESALDFEPQAESERHISPCATHPASPVPGESFNKQDSGYSSNVSHRSTSVEKADRISLETDRRSFVEKVFKPILKNRKSSSEVPDFRNIHPATASPQASSTSITRVAEAGVDTPKKAKKLTKRLPLLRQKQPIVLQTIQSIDDLSIPPVPTEAIANLRIRAQAVPELETTYSSMHHSRNRNSVSTVGLEDFQMDLRFPSPEPERPKQQRRRSWFGKPKKENVPLPSKRNSKRMSQDARGISQQQAMAIINEWDMNAASLSSTPYDQIPCRRNSQHRQPQHPHREPPLPPRRPNKLLQRRTMDDRTAADYARQRSASIRERDAWDARTASMSRKREPPATPAGSYRSSGLILNMPPMPCQDSAPWEHRESPLEIPEPTDLPPSSSKAHYIPPPDLPPPPPPHSPRPFDVELHDEPVHTSEDVAPPPPPHSPRPSSVERSDYFDQQEEYEAPPPPPPSHSPRPMDVSDEDPWASQAAAWALRRQHAAFQQDEMSSPVHMQEDDDIYPTIALRREVYPHTAGADFAGYHYPHQPRPQKRHTFDIYQSVNSFDQDDQYRPEPPRGRSSFENNPSQPRFYDRSTSRPHSQSNTPARSREVSPRPPPHSHSRSPHPHSRSHSRSPAASRPASRQPSPAPAFGRFSGGLQYQYDGENGGLGGSAGTRDNAAISENARSEYKGMQLRREWGVDLGDVPVSVLVGPSSFR